MPGGSKKGGGLKSSPVYKKQAFGIWDQSRSYNRGDCNKQKWWTVDTEREAMLRSRGMNPRINRERMMTNVGRPQSWGGVGGTYELA